MSPHRSTALIRAVVMALLLALAVPVAAWAGSATHQDAELHAFPGTGVSAPEEGTAHLVRNDHGVRTRIRARHLTPGVYTLWWVVWNAPEECATPFACDEGDLTNPDVGLDIGFGGGRIVGANGNLNLAASLREDTDLTGFPQEFGLALTNEGLTDARHAEVHLVLRTHGEPIDGMVDEMLHSFNGGCRYEGPIAGTAPAYGPAGPHTCTDVLFAVLPSEDA